MTALAPVSRQKRWHLRMWLFLGKVFPSAELANLSFIHVATWSVVRQRTGLWNGYLLFMSNFSGDSDEYIANFTDVVPTRVARSFGWCDGFPGAQPSDGFIAYERSHDFPPSLYYSAFPNQTVRDIGLYLGVSERVDALVKAADSRSVDSFCQAYNEVLETAQEHAQRRITVRQRVSLVLRSWWPGRRMQSVTAILPFKKDVDVDGALAALKPVLAEIFDKVKGTHFARFVKLPNDAPDSLLFSAQVDGRPKPYVARLGKAILGRQELAKVFELCEGWPADDRRGLGRWLRRSMVPAQLLIAGNRRASVPEILKARDRTVDFLEFDKEHQSSSGQELLDAFRKAEKLR
jgi:hypothetical protein